MVSGEGCRADCTSRVRGLLAIVVEGAVALPDNGCRGVEFPVEEAEIGGRRVPREALFKSDGSCGSIEIAPSF